MQDNNNKLTVTFTVGIPTSGKTTWTNSLRKEDTIISFDDTILTYFRTDNYNEAIKAYQNAPKEERQQINNIQKIIFLMALKNKKNIIIDKTHLSYRQIEKFYNLIPEFYKKNCVVFPITLEEALKRNKERENKTIPENVLRQMYENYENQEYKKIKWDSVIKMPLQRKAKGKKTRDSLLRVRISGEDKADFELLCKSRNDKVSARIRELIKKDLRGEI